MGKDKAHSTDGLLDIIFKKDEWEGVKSIG